MSDIELYKEIGLWVKSFHFRSFYRQNLLRDFQNDIWIRLHTKQNINRQYIKKVCYYYPLEAIRTLYYKKDRSWVSREVVILGEEGDYKEFPSDCVVDFEFSFEKPKKRGRYLSDEMVSEIKAARLEGLNYKQLSVKFKIAESAAYNAVNKERSKHREVKVTYLNGESQEFKSASDCARSLKVSYQTVSYFLKGQNTNRFTNRKMSHIKIITYADSQSV